MSRLRKWAIPEGIACDNQLIIQSSLVWVNTVVNKTSCDSQKQHRGCSGEPVMTFLDVSMKSHVSFHYIPAFACSLGYGTSLKWLLCNALEHSVGAVSFGLQTCLRIYGLGEVFAETCRYKWSCWSWKLFGLALPCLTLLFLFPGLDAELSYVRNDVVNHYALSFNLLIPSETNNLHFTWHAKSKVSMQTSALGTWHTSCSAWWIHCYHLMAFFFAKISICKVQNPYLYGCRQ